MERVMVLILPNLLNIQSCIADLCLSWYSENDKVILRCKTDSLRFPVFFYSPTGKEVASCNIPFPQPLCHSLMPNIIVDQDLKTQITTLTYMGNIYSSMNGEWQCRHGINREGGSVNVTVLQVKDPLTEKENHERSLAGLKSRECKKFNFAVMMAITSSLGGLIGLPLLVGSLCKDCCNDVGGGLFVLFGCVVAVLINLLTDMFNYVQTNDLKWSLANYSKTKLKRKEVEEEFMSF